MKIYVFILFFVCVFNHTAFSQLGIPSLRADLIYNNTNFELPKGDSITLSRGKKFELKGNSSFTFTFKDRTSGIINGNSSSSSSGSVSIDSTSKIIFKLPSYFEFDETWNYRFVSGLNLPNIKISQESIISDNVLFSGKIQLDGSIDVKRNDANDIFKHLPKGVNDTLNEYLGGNKFFDAALSGYSVAESEKAMLSLGEMNKATGILHLNNIISSAISHEVIYNMNGRQALNQGDMFFTGVPMSIWFAPLAIFSSKTEKYETGIEVGSDVSSYGGIIALDVSLPYLVNSRIGLVTGGGVGFSKSTGYYSETSNEVGYLIGGLYYSLAYSSMRFVFSSTYIGMLNNVLYDINGGDLQSDFATHNVETAFNFTYDFKMGNFYISPFVGINHSLYIQPTITFLFDYEIVIITKNNMKNTLFAPVGLTLGYEFKLSDKNIITPSVRVNANITLFDTGIYSVWLFTNPDIKMEFNTTEAIGLLDANFNLAWQKDSLMLYGDYTIRLFDGYMTHLASIGSRWFF